MRQLADFPAVFFHICISVLIINIININQLSWATNYADADADADADAPIPHSSVFSLSED